MDHNILSEGEIIEQARQGHTHLIEINTVLDACESFYFSGLTDQVSGDVQAPTGHFYRVHRWIVITDSAGLHELQTFDDATEAIKAFDTLEEEYDDYDKD